jgi:uncharacterized protein
MRIEDERLFELEDALLALPAERDGMLLSDFDGCVVGLHCCPELIPPSEWLPLVWGEDTEEDADGDADGSTPFPSMEQLEATVALMLRHYNAVAAALARRRYDPIFVYDDPDDDVVWEPWVAGFVTAMELRPTAWMTLLQSDDQDVVRAVAGLTMLADVDAGEIELPEDENAALNEAAPDLIADWAQLLYDRRLAAEGAVTVRAGPKVGRNDPCPCGSGKKYKKCCGAH